MIYAQPGKIQLGVLSRTHHGQIWKNVKKAPGTDCVTIQIGVLPMSVSTAASAEAFADERLVMTQSGHWRFSQMTVFTALLRMNYRLP